MKAPHSHRTKVYALLAAVAATSALIAGASLSGEVLASEKCSVPQSEWQPQEALRQKLADEGWQEVKRIKVDDGCYEVYGRTADGRRAEIYFDPKTFTVVQED
jgi:hypothetical protein